MKHYENFPVRLSVWYNIAYHTSETFLFQIILPPETGKEKNECLSFGLLSLHTQDYPAIPKSFVRSLTYVNWSTEIQYFCFTATANTCPLNLFQVCNTYGYLILQQQKQHWFLHWILWRKISVWYCHVELQCKISQLFGGLFFKNWTNIILWQLLMHMKDEEKQQMMATSQIWCYKPEVPMC